MPSVTNKKGWHESTLNCALMISMSESRKHIAYCDDVTFSDDDASEDKYAAIRDGLHNLRESMLVGAGGDTCYFCLSQPILVCQRTTQSPLNLRQETAFDGSDSCDSIGLSRQVKRNFCEHVR